MAEKKDKKAAPAKAEKKAPAKEPVAHVHDHDEEAMPHYMECAECGMIISIDETCGCEPKTLSCCGHPMVDLKVQPSQVGSLYECKKCNLRIIVEEDCECENTCDLVCCGKPMVLCED